MSSIRHGYSPRGTGFMPYLPVALGHADCFTEDISFLVDSGALLSFAPKIGLAGIFPEIIDMPELPSCCQDAHGRVVHGTPITVTLLINGLPNLKEEVWFSKDTQLYMLGETFFEKLDTRFCNFHPDRHFVLEPKI